MGRRRGLGGSPESAVPSPANARKGSDLGMPKVRLMLTCLCDAFYGEVGIATVKVLEHAGCEVTFESAQTCCGQPPYNAGDWDTARKVARHCQDTLLNGEDIVVTPSSSCAAMIDHGYPELGLSTSHAYELSEFLVRELKLESWPAKKPYPKKIALHKACHGRGLGLKNEQEILLQGIPGLQMMPFAHSEQCCGFGGAFSVTHGTLSGAIGLEKLARIKDSGAEEIISGDMGCLMHLKGLIGKHDLKLGVRHFAEILAEVIEP